MFCSYADICDVFFLLRKPKWSFKTCYNFKIFSFTNYIYLRDLRTWKQYLPEIGTRKRNSHAIQVGISFDVFWRGYFRSTVEEFLFFCFFGRMFWMVNNPWLIMSSFSLVGTIKEPSESQWCVARVEFPDYLKPLRQIYWIPTWNPAIFLFFSIIIRLIRYV